jgi:hypothetical protein
LLAGQRVETDFCYEMTADERAAWQRHVAQVSAVADASASVHEALRLVTQDGFAWPAA